MTRLWQFSRTPEGLKMIKFTMVSVISALTSLVVLAIVYGGAPPVVRGAERALRQPDGRDSLVPAQPAVGVGEVGPIAPGERDPPFAVISVTGIGFSLFTASLAHHYADAAPPAPPGPDRAGPLHQYRLLRNPVGVQVPHPQPALRPAPRRRGGNRAYPSGPGSRRRWAVRLPPILMTREIRHVMAGNRVSLGRRRRLPSIPRHRSCAKGGEVAATESDAGRLPWGEPHPIGVPDGFRTGEAGRCRLTQPETDLPLLDIDRLERSSTAPRDLPGGRAVSPYRAGRLPRARGGRAGHGGVPPLDPRPVEQLPACQRTQVQQHRSRHWGPTLRSILDELNSPRFVDFVSSLIGIDHLIPDPSLEGGGLHQSGTGGFLNIHADFTVHPHNRKWQRRANILLYLNDDWKPEYGGDLELWSADMKECVEKVTPLANRVLIFTTDATSFHGHPEPMTCPEDVSRQSLALYYFTIEEDPLVRSTEYRARPGDGAHSIMIYADKQMIRIYDWTKRKLGSLDQTASKILGYRDRLRRRGYQGLVMAVPTIAAPSGAQRSRR